MNPFLIVARSAAFVASAACVLAPLACGSAENTEPRWEELGAPPASAYPFDTSLNQGPPPDPSFVPDRPKIDFIRSALRREGEVLVIEGDARTVTRSGTAWGITNANETEIVKAVLAEYPDVFDTIQFFLAFTDQAHAGSAYYESIKSSVSGIGIQAFDNRARFGLPREGRLSGLSNMNNMTMWGGIATAAAPKGYFFAVMAQELSHRWMMHLKFKDVTGAVKDDLIGRQDAHWSALAHAYGSCQDGIGYADNHDGTFTVTASMDNGWAPLDQYAMGILGPEEVEPFYYLTDARLNDLRLTKTSQRQLFKGARVRGTRVDVGINQVVDAMGPRNPPKGTETPYYRAAFVLLTYPGQPQSEWQPYLDALQRVQEAFPATWKEWTGGHGAICTKVSARCPESMIGLQSTAILDGNDNLLAPGEPFELQVAVRNDGSGTTRNVSVALGSIGSGIEVRSAAPIIVPEIAEHTAVDLASRFALAVKQDAPCGFATTVEIRATTEEGPAFVEPIEIPIGTKSLSFDPLNVAGDWTVNPDSSDSAMKGKWDLGRPQFGSALGVITQLGQDHSPGDTHLSFNTGSMMGSLFNSNAVQGGKTTLQSPVYPLKNARDPTLAFYVWHLALDFSMQGGPRLVPGTELLVQGSDDGGTTWVELGKIDENTKAWTRKSFRIRDKLKLTDKIKFRFAIANTTPSATVKAGIDDVSVIDFLPECKVAGDKDPNATAAKHGGCRCATSAAGGDAGAAFRGFALLFFSWVAFFRAGPSLRRHAR